MTQWIVEGTRVDSFRLAHDLAQQYADREQALVPLVRHCVEQGYVVVKMVGPRPKSCRTMRDPSIADGSFHPLRLVLGAGAPTWNHSVRHRMN